MPIPVTIHRLEFKTVNASLPDLCPGCWQWVKDVGVTEASYEPVGYEGVIPHAGDAWNYTERGEIHAGDWGESYAFEYACNGCGHVLAAVVTCESCGETVPQSEAEQGVDFTGRGLDPRDWVCKRHGFSGMEG